MRNFAIACLIVALVSPAAIAEIVTPANTVDDSAVVASQSGPVAYVYVSNNPPNSSTNEIRAYAAAANGALTPVVGSPFADDIVNMAVNGKYLFGSTRSGIYIAQFAMEPDGRLSWTRSTNVVRYNQGDCGQSGPLFLDRTGASLYDMEFNGNGCSNNSYQSFRLAGPTAQPQNLGSGASDSWYYLPATFTGNNAYAYTAVCLGNMYWEISGFRRTANGMLSQMNAAAPMPAPPSGDFFCPSQVAADSANHIAITLQGVNQQSFGSDGAARLATYTVDAAGNLHTASTLANMPQTAVGAVTSLAMAPSGTLLAVAGSAGLQLFRYNGGAPIAAATGLLAKAGIDQLYWDRANHLYAIGKATNKLYVFTVTAGGATPAPGSPYTIANPQNLVVQPR